MSTERRGPDCRPDLIEEYETGRRKDLYAFLNYRLHRFMWETSRSASELMQFKQAFHGDYYATHSHGTYLNFASMTQQSPSVKEAAKNIHDLQKTDQLSTEQKRKLLDKVRTKAAELINLPDSRGVVIGRNTTHVLSMFRWLRDIYSHAHITPHVLVSDIENPATVRTVQFLNEDGNQSKDDPITTHSNFAPRRKRVRGMSPACTSFDILHTRGKSIRDIQIKLKKAMAAAMKPDILLLSHVSREDGSELPLTDLISDARQSFSDTRRAPSDLYVVIDGAQALGNIPQIDFRETGADFYVASPHKTLGAEPLGLGFFDPNDPKLHEGIEFMQKLPPRFRPKIPIGMFDESVLSPNSDEEVNYGDAAAFLQAITEMTESGWLQGNDFHVLHKHRSELRSRLLDSLAQTNTSNDWAVNIPEREHQTSFIASFRLRNKHFSLGALSQRFFSYAGLTASRQKGIAKQFDDAGVQLSYLAAPDLFRTSFDRTTTGGDIERFATVLRQILG